MNEEISRNRTVKRMFVNILSIFVILAIAFPVTESAYAQEPVFPEGNHDGVEGIVNAASCGAFGWAVDPDDPDRDLQVQILSDGNWVTTVTADLLREDVGACTGGTCGFGINLWGLVSAGVEHLITAQAYDQETSTWVDLPGTPKSLTCWGYPEGFHDGMEGSVNADSCTAFGWAVDPDNRDRDVQVRILADGEQITSLTASDYGEDMEQNNICPNGTCRFTANLWELISPDVEHEIIAQAYDEETDAWLNLEATSKLLTCQTPPPPTPFIAVSLTQEWFMGDYWLPESLVTIKVYEYQDAATPVLELSRYTDVSGHLNIEGWEHNWDLKVGNYVTATDGASTKELLLEYVTLDVFDPDHEIISGITLPGREVGVGVGHGNEEQWLNVFADAVTGAWTADFTTVGFNITPDMWAGAHVNDEDGDVTSAHNSGRSVAPVPHIVASLTEDWFYLVNFPPSASFNLSVYESQGGSLLWEGTGTTDEWGFVWIDAEGRWAIEAGTYLVVSDGTLTKDLVVEAFTFDVFDVTQGLLEGTAPAPFGRRVWVGVGWEGYGWFMDVTTNRMSAWTADFDAPIPNGYNWVAAQIFDPDGDASELRPLSTIDRTVTLGNFYVEWSTTNPEEIVNLRWNGSMNLTNPFGYADSPCPQDLEYFGNSWVSENEGTDPFFFASLAGYGMTGTWKEQSNARIRIGSISSGCPGSADIPIKTDYRFFNDALRANLMVVQRTFKFGDVPYTHNVRPFIPRLYPSDGFTEVIHPNAAGDELVTDTTCDFGCVAESWNGTWFAIHNPTTGLGMIVQRKPSPYAAALWLDDDDGSFTNSSSMLLLQPEGGFNGAVTETENLCFYDSNIWTPSLTLPPGCQP